MINRSVVACIVFLLFCLPAASEDKLNVVWERKLIKGGDEAYILDFDGDDVPEIYVVSYSNKDTILSCFASNGTLLWDAAIPLFSYSAYPTEEVKYVAVGDADGDKYLDLIVGGEAIAASVSYHPVYLVERELEKDVEGLRIVQSWRYEKADLANSAHFSRYFGGEENYVVVASNDFKVYVFNLGGEVVESYDVGGSAWDAETVNLDNDSELEIVAGSFMGVTLVDNKNVSWVFKTPERVVDVAAADLDGDGKTEIIGVTRFGLNVLDSQGHIIWEKKLEDVTSNLLVSDLEGDGRFEILVGSGGVFRILNFNGTVTTESDFEGRINSVAAIDVDGDGAKELFLGLNNRILLIRLSVSHVIEERAQKAYDDAVRLYSVGEIKKSVSELSSAIELFSEVEQYGLAGNLSILLREYKDNLALEDTIKEAFNHLREAEKLYGKNLFNESRVVAEKSQSLFESINNSYGARDAGEIIQNINDRLRADVLLVESEKHYVTGEFEYALNKSRIAKALFTRLNLSLGRKKSAYVESLSLIELETSTMITTVYSSTTLRRRPVVIKPSEEEEVDYLLYVSGGLILVMLGYMVKMTLGIKKRKKKV